MILWDNAKDGEMYGHGLMSHCIVKAEQSSPLYHSGYRYLAHAGLERKPCMTQREAIHWCQMLDDDLKL